MLAISFNSVLIIAGIAVLVPVVLGLLPRLPVPGAVLEVIAGIVVGRARPAGRFHLPAGRAGYPAAAAGDHFHVDVRWAAAAIAEGRGRGNNPVRPVGHDRG